MQRVKFLRALPTWSLLILVLLLLVGCGGSRDTSGTEIESQQQGNGGTEQSASQETKKYLGEVSFGLATDTITYSPLFVADKRGYFQDEGLNVKIITMEGTAPAVQALVGGTIEFICLDPGGVMNGYNKGIDFYSIASMVNRLTMDLVVSNQVIEATGVTPDSPVEARLMALKGLTIGITGAGAPTDLFSRYYLKQANLDPQTDARLLAIGAGPSLTAALKQGQINAFMLGAPIPQVIEAEGIGKIFLRGASGELPELAKFDYLSLTTRKSYAERNPEITRAMARAFARANNFIIDHPEETLEILKEHYSQVDPEILEASLEATAPAFSRDGLMSEASWENSLSIYKSVGIVTEDVEIQEGILWTNEYVKDVKGKSE